jgi:hypothetical protein
MPDALTGNSPAATRLRLLQLPALITSTLQRVLGGDGTESALSLSTTAAKVDGTLQATGTVTADGIAKVTRLFLYSPAPGTGLWHEVKLHVAETGQISAAVEQTGTATPS